MAKMCFFLKLTLWQLKVCESQGNIQIEYIYIG